MLKTLLNTLPSDTLQKVIVELVDKIMLKENKIDVLYEELSTVRTEIEEVRTDRLNMDAEIENRIRQARVEIYQDLLEEAKDNLTQDNATSICGLVYNTTPHKIMAIKAYRAITKKGLKDSKDWLDNWCKEEEEETGNRFANIEIE